MGNAKIFYSVWSGSRGWKKIEILWKNSFASNFIVLSFNLSFRFSKLLAIFMVLVLISPQNPLILTCWEYYFMTIISWLFLLGMSVIAILHSEIPYILSVKWDFYGANKRWILLQQRVSQFFKKEIRWNPRTFRLLCLATISHKHLKNDMAIIGSPGSTKYKS